MSKPIKELIVADYKKRFDNLDGALIVDIRGVDANDTNDLRLGLRKKKIRVTVIKNTLAKKAFSGTNLEALTAGLNGPTALAYGETSVIDVARELVDWARKIKALTLKGAVLDGHYYDGEKGVKQLSQFPTREEALGQVVQLIFSPAAELVGSVVAPGANLMAIVEAMIQKLEKGEAINKVA